MRWAWAASLALLWPQLVFLGGVGARREQKRTRQPGQRTETPNATAANSEVLPGSPKVHADQPTWARACLPLASGAWARGRPPTYPLFPPCLLDSPTPSRLGGAGLRAGSAAEGLGRCRASGRSGEGRATAACRRPCLSGWGGAWAADPAGTAPTVPTAPKVGAAKAGLDPVPPEALAPSPAVQLAPPQWPPLLRVCLAQVL